MTSNGNTSGREDIFVSMKPLGLKGKYFSEFTNLTQNILPRSQYSECGSDFSSQNKWIRFWAAEREKKKEGTVGASPLMIPSLTVSLFAPFLCPFSFNMFPQTPGLHIHVEAFRSGSCRQDLVCSGWRTEMQDLCPSPFPQLQLSTGTTGPHVSLFI